MSIRAVMEGIEVRLQTIQGLRTSPTATGQINPPQAIVGVPPVADYQQAYARGKFALEPTITVLTSAAWDRTGQFALADYLDYDGPKSIERAIAADPTLGGAAESCQVLNSTPLGIEEVGVIGYFGGLISLRCLVKVSP